ncbi:MAG: ACP S-malonyltransferase [Gemmatimonadales bacterium]
MVTILLFPGQGAQQVGMAADLADEFPAAREALRRSDDALGFPLSRLMAEGPDADLTRTENAQPAILAHSVAVLDTVRERLGEVVAAAGHSLGEYSAWVASGVLDPADAARLVRRRGELMAGAGAARPGAMSAVLGLDSGAVVDACSAQSAETGRTVVAANLNAPDQVVISGDPDAVAAAGERCRAAGAKRVVALNVSGAFHSPLMEPAAAGLREALAATTFGPAAFPVIANATASMACSPADAMTTLGMQLTAPVRWVESMRLLAQRFPAARWLELGPGTVLTGLLRRIVPGSDATALGTATQLRAWLAA